MDVPKIFESEYRFCLILWDNEPINSSELARLCGDKLGWKKSTTYTVIKRLAERGVLKNTNSIVTTLISKDEIQYSESHEVVEKTFGGSLPQFVAAFTRRHNLTPEEIAEIKRMIDKQEDPNKEQ